MAKIRVRPATATDLAKIMGIIGAAKARLKRQGIPQWQAAYPARGDISADLAAGTGRVLLVGDQVAAYASLEDAPEPVYDQLSGGHWQDSGPYSTIHRVAMGATFQGQHLSLPFMRGLIAEAARAHPAVRVDTQTENLVMQHILTQLGFGRRGLVRWTFEVPVVECWAYELNLPAGGEARQ
ncbi:acetyltransferase [Lacticaseibacillus jixianensis]|uniref:Acetyltransferase n=1 Tax=Lacticaseibacillus jixianensis TaxID=2486012 RepID=A0ABW4BDB1_9LACO|nr:acetyltransferase [Lacticaseibacillus jixianensis]